MRLGLSAPRSSTTPSFFWGSPRSPLSSSTSCARFSSAPRGRSSSTSATISSAPRSAQPSFFQRHRTGDIMARSTNDLNAVRQLLGPAIMYCGKHGRLHRLRTARHDPHQPRLTLLAFLPLPFVSVLVQYFGARIHTRFERIQAMFSDISARPRRTSPGLGLFARSRRRRRRLRRSKRPTASTSAAACCWLA